MFNFLRGTRKTKSETAAADTYLQDQLDEETADHNEKVATTLSIPENWKLNEEDYYVFAFYNTQAPELNENQISIYGMELLWTDEGVDVTGLIRSSVSKPIQFGMTNVLLLDEEGNRVARGNFDLSELGSVPPYSARPWTFRFTDEFTEDTKETLTGNWSLAFELKKTHKLELAASWEEAIDQQTREHLESIVANAPALKQGEVNFMGIQAKQKANGDLAATVLIRNGSERSIHLQQVPLGMKDISGEEIARGQFNLENFVVRPHASTPWTFIFPSHQIKKDSIDLSSWSVYVIQKE